MAEQIIKRYEDLIATGTQLAPLGGFDFSGYNARLQNKYLEWRKGCLEALESVGPIGFPYKQKILGDANGGFFFQSSAQLILNCIRELFEKLKASPDLAAAAPVASQPVQSTVTATESGGARVLKPPPKPQAAQQPVQAQQPQAQAPAPVASTQNNKVYVVGESNDPLTAQLLQFLGEISLEAVEIKREHGQMLPLDSFQMDANIKFAFFIVNSEDLSYAMFELGHFVGKLGKNRVCVLHMSDVNFPKNMPGVNVKTIVVKLEEASFGLLKDLKALGYQINL
jgi:hypothetical protein